MNVHTYHVLLLNNKDTAEWWLENFYDYEVNYIVLTADGTYPKDEQIRNDVWGMIAKDEHKSLVVIGRDAIKSITTNKRIWLDPLLLHDLRSEWYHLPDSEFFEESKFGLTPKKLVNLIFCLMDQTNLRPDERPRDPWNSYAYKSHDHDENTSWTNWMARLVSGKNHTINCIRNEDGCEAYIDGWSDAVGSITIKDDEMYTWVDSKYEWLDIESLMKKNINRE